MIQQADTIFYSESFMIHSTLRIVQNLFSYSHVTTLLQRNVAWSFVNKYTKLNLFSSSVKTFIIIF